MASSWSAHCRPTPAAGLQQQDFGLSRFAIDRDRKQVTCHNGTIRRNWHDSCNRQGLPII
jgi:hypothetical protein